MKLTTCLLLVLSLCFSCSVNKGDEILPVENEDMAAFTPQVNAQGKCLDNCFLTLDFGATTFPIAQEVRFDWNYSASIATNPNVCNTTAIIEFRAITNVTSCNGIVTPYTESFSMDISSDFLANPSGSITVDAPVGAGAVIANYELPNKVYEFRLWVRAQCGLLYCCHNTDWDCFANT